jgi:ABC-type sulfate/molybdate transport systems ATPase subunit
MTLLKVTGVSKKGETGFILEDISFTQRRLQKIAIAGETGSGKSTLLKIIAGLGDKDSGEVLFNKHAVTGPSENLVPGHSGIRYLSQDFDLPRSLRVEQVLEYSNTRVMEEVNVLYEVCRINHLLKRKTDQLSGGERQRIAIARLLIASPELLLLDEPFTNLDRIHKGMLKSVIKDIVGQLRTSIILISHDPEDILSWADKVLIMKEGKIIQKGTPKKIYRYPVTEYAAGLFGKYTVLDPRDSPFNKFFPQSSAPRKVFIRPEQFKIVSRRAKTIPGEVIQVTYVGSYEEVEVQCGEQMITVKAEAGDFSSGDKVYVSVSME